MSRFDGVVSRAFLVLVGIALLWLVGCASGPRPPAEPIQLQQAQTEVPQSRLLDVGIVVLDPGLPPEGTSEEEKGIFDEVRRSEAHFIAIQLQDTMQESGAWGAVRTIPNDEHVTDLTVTGQILESNGFELAVGIVATDSTGRVWLEHAYKEEADSASHTPGAAQSRDAFQNLYNRIANDLFEELEDLKVGDLHEIRQVSRMRFAADLAPLPYADYLNHTRKGHWRLERLPAEDDPMMVRLAHLRARDDLFVDTLNQHYANFYRQMEAPYDSWRKFSYEEVLAYKKMKRKALTQKLLGAAALLGAMVMAPGSSTEAIVRDVAAMGGLWAIQAGISTSQEAKMHVEAIRELGQSFNAEIAPIVIEVEGRTLRLQGSAATQYEEWRDLLRQIYAEETGLGDDVNAPSGP